MKHDYLGRSTGKFPGATEKVILFFPDGMFQMEIRVLFL